MAGKLSDVRKLKKNPWLINKQPLQELFYLDLKSQAMAPLKSPYG